MDSELFSDINPVSSATSCPALFFFQGVGWELCFLDKSILQNLSQENKNYCNNMEAD